MTAPSMPRGENELREDNRVLAHQAYTLRAALGALLDAALGARLAHPAVERARTVLRREGAQQPGTAA